jgi:hypothetical protein
MPSWRAMARREIPVGPPSASCVRAAVLMSVIVSCRRRSRRLGRTWVKIGWPREQRAGIFEQCQVFAHLPPAPVVSRLGRYGKTWDARGRRPAEVRVRGRRASDDTAARQDDRVITDIRELQRAFDDAELHADTDRLNALLADDFMSIGERGFQLDKQQWIARHADFAYLSLETAELDVRCYDHAAIVRCIQRSRASWRGDAMTLTQAQPEHPICEPA